MRSNVTTLGLLATRHPTAAIFPRFSAWTGLRQRPGLSESVILAVSVDALRFRFRIVAVYGCYLQNTQLHGDSRRTTSLHSKTVSPEILCIRFGSSLVPLNAVTVTLAAVLPIGSSHPSSFNHPANCSTAAVTGLGV